MHLPIPTPRFSALLSYCFAAVETSTYEYNRASTISRVVGRKHGRTRLISTLRRGNGAGAAWEGGVDAC